MITENLSTLKIHKLTKEQYERELAAGRLDENAIYLTPDESVDISNFVTQDELSSAIASIPTPDVSGQINEHNNSQDAHADIRALISEKSDFSGSYNDLTDKPTDLTTKTYVDTQDASILSGANQYTDEKIALLLNNSSEAVDSIMELAAAMEENEDVVDALEAAIGTKADAEHSHDDRYYTETEVDGLLTSKADAVHSHDDLYYTKAQIDELELVTAAEIDAICGTTTNAVVVTADEGVF